MTDIAPRTTTPPSTSADAAERAKRRAELEKRMKEVLAEWDEGREAGTATRYQNLQEAATWVDKEGGSSWGPIGWVADKASEATRAVGETIGEGLGRGSPRPETDEKDVFSSERLPSGRRRSQVLDEYKALQREREELDQRSANLGMTPEQELEALGFANKDAQEASQWLRVKRLIPVITDRELEDMARTGQMDLTPDYIANLYLKATYDSGKDEWGTAPDTRPFSDPMSGANVRFDRADMDVEAELRKIQNDMESMGEETSRTGGFVGSRSGAWSGNPARRRRDTLAANPNQGPTSLRDALARPYRMSKEELSSLGVSLFEAGYMEVSNWDPKKPLSVQTALGDPYNPEFQKAYQRWLLDTYRDRTKSATEILDERKKANKPVFDEIASEMAKEKAKRLAQVTRLSDPLALRQAAESFAKQILGREFISEGEINSLIGMVHSQQTAYGQQVVAAEESGAGPTAITEVDPEAQLRAALEANHPVEAEAYATAGQYENFLSMIGAAGGRI